MNILPINNVIQSATYQVQQNLNKGLLITGQVVKNLSPKMGFVQTHPKIVYTLAFFIISGSIITGWNAAIKLEDKIENKKHIPTASLMLSTVVLVPQLVLKYIVGFPLSKKFIAIVTISCLFSRLFVATRKQKHQELEQTKRDCFKEHYK